MILSLLFSGVMMQAQASSCEISAPQMQRYLGMNYQDFDQKKDGGWRVELQKHCLATSANLIDRYRSANRRSLSADEVRILYWHAAQLYGMLGKMDLALPRFQNSFDPEEPAKSSARWNSYVRGTIAYFEFNLAGLKAARDDVARGSDSSLNLAILDGMIHCFNLPRSEAYSEKCRPSK